MDRVQFFMDAIAALLEAAPGVGYRVYGCAMPAEPATLHAEVRCNDAQEVMAGNHLYRLDCAVVLTGLSAAEKKNEIDRHLQRAGKAYRAVLSGGWFYRPLPHPQPGSDPEYEAAPFIVNELVMELQPPEVDDLAYEGVLGFRAYVQF